MSQSLEEIEEGLSREDYEYENIQKLYDSVSEIRGMGMSGREIHIVEKECEHKGCSYDRQIQTIRVSPEQKDRFEYDCQNPMCPNFHEGRLGIRKF